MITLRDKCSHNIYMGHWYHAQWRPVRRWCPGGRERTFQQERPFDWNGSEDRWVLVEVDR